MADIFDFADTWNDGGTTFDAISVDITDSASAADSTLINLLRDAASEFKVTKGGAVAIAASGSISFGAVEILGDSAGTTTLSNIDAIDATTEATLGAALEVSVPSGPSASGTVGQWARSGIYYYRCVATDTWMQFIGSTSGWSN